MNRHAFAPQFDDERYCGFCNKSRDHGIHEGRDYDPRDPKVQAGIAEFMGNHEHQYTCAICSHNLDVEQEKLAETVETAKTIWGIYSARSELGEKMFDFEKWLPDQIKDWEAQLREQKLIPLEEQLSALFQQGMTLEAAEDELRGDKDAKA